MQKRIENQRIDILGVSVDGITQKDLHSAIVSTISNKSKALILNVNIHCLNLAYNNSWLSEFLNSADIVFCDGAGVILGARILGYSIPERITYADWTWILAEFAQERGLSFFFLGARHNVAENVKVRLIERFPNLRVVGTHHGYFDKEMGSLENDAVIHKINSVKPNILFLGFGMPLQEHWLMENWDRIDANVALTGGGSL